MLCVNVHHGGIRPASRAFYRDNTGNRSATCDQNIHLEGPRTGSGDTFIGEVIHLDEGIMPVTGNQLTLGTEQIECGAELVRVKRIGVSDAEFGVMVHEIESSIGNVN